MIVQSFQQPYMILSQIREQIGGFRPFRGTIQINRVNPCLHAGKVVPFYCPSTVKVLSTTKIGVPYSRSYLDLRLFDSWEGIDWVGPGDRLVDVLDVLLVITKKGVHLSSTKKTTVKNSIPQRREAPRVSRVIEGTEQLCWISSLPSFQSVPPPEPSMFFILEDVSGKGASS